MRGKEASWAWRMTSGRITPAHAGKRRAKSLTHCAPEDHPRACGEKQVAYRLAEPVLGSPPRMRGKEVTSADFRHAPGITPAHAGKSQKLFLSLAALWDHPRACGEKLRQRLASWTTRGSPPRMRGKAAAAFDQLNGRRITPAHAGKRPDRDRGGAAAKDHPRACGEK